MDRTDALSRLQSSGQYALELEAVSRHFGALVALADINIAVKAGERRAILGSNGAGKTTLFNAVTGDFPVTTGRIRFFGEDITALPPQERIRRGLRRTYQISLLFENLSVRNNLFVACRGVSAHRAALRRAGPSDPAIEMSEMLAKATHLEDALDFRVATLSHGQQRQLEIGMALAGAPRFILLDEPAAGLSPSERTELIEILAALPAHIGYVIIEHDMDIALRVAETVSMMHNGRIFREGTPAEIESDPDVQALYLGGVHG
tara:strand:+ start:1072 stop:1857 length:786 start_codon:yes stop_codon:yes gene_type:complete